MLKKVLIGVGSFIGLIIIILGVVFFLFTRPSSLKNQMTPVSISAEAARNFDSKMEAFNRLLNEAKTSGQKKEVSLTLTQEEATSKVDQMLREATTQEVPVDAKNIQINLTDGEIKAVADVSVSGFNVSAGIRAKIELKDGQPEVVVQEINTGRIPIPGAVKNKIMDSISQGGSTLKVNLPLDISSINIENGKLTLQGITR